MKNGNKTTFEGKYDQTQGSLTCNDISVDNARKRKKNHSKYIKDERDSCPPTPPSTPPRNWETTIIQAFKKNEDFIETHFEDFIDFKNEV